MPCLLVLYGAEPGRTRWAEMEPMLMMRPPPCFFMMRKCFARAEKRAAQIDGHHLVPRLQRQLIEGAAIEDAGVVDQDIEPAETLDGLGENPDHLGFIGNVGDDGENLKAACRRVPARVLSSSSALAADQNQAQLLQAQPPARCLYQCLDCRR